MRYTRLGFCGDFRLAINYFNRNSPYTMCLRVVSTILYSACFYFAMPTADRDLTFTFYYVML